MIFVYKIITDFLFVVALPFLPFVYFFSEKRRANLMARLGFNSSFKSSQPGKKRLWIHALSVGEVISAIPFVSEFKKKYENWEIVFTASTKTGFDMANHLLLQKSIPLADQLGYFPFDLGFCVKRILRKIAPDAVVIVETDLWPCFLYEMKKNGIPVVLINARLSERSLKGYLLFKKFCSLFFSSLSMIMVQTMLDKNRFKRLGINENKIVVTGNIKFDQPVVNMEQHKTEQLKKKIGIQDETFVLVAGSTHDGEETILCNVFKQIKKFFPKSFMILAPRNPERCSAILSDFLSYGVDTVLMSDMDGAKKSFEVVLVDKMGILSRLYAVCAAAFVGGSMVKRGGHNPLEAAAFAKPILFGPDMSDFLQISTMLQECGGARVVSSELELKNEVKFLLENRDIGQQMGQKNFEVFSNNSGAIQRIIQQMEGLGIV